MKNFYKCGSRCFTFMHWAWVEDVYEEFQRLYVPDLPHEFGNGIIDDRQLNSAF